MALIEPKTVVLKDGRTACIRTRRDDEAEAVFDCLKAVFSDDRFFGSTYDEMTEWLDEEKFLERNAEYNDHPHKLLLVAETDGRIVSLSDVVCGSKSRYRHVAQLGISVRAEYRGIGLGTAILRTMIDWAGADPVIEKLSLCVWAQNERAIGLYEKMGFVQECRKAKEAKYADGTYDDMLSMYRWVD